MKTLDIDDCAEFLKIGNAMVAEMVETGELPGARIGRSWVFLEDDLVEYVRNQVRHQRRERQAVLIEKQQGAGQPVEQDNLANLASLLHSRRGRRDPPFDRSPGFTDEDAPLSSRLGG